MWWVLYCCRVNTCVKSGPWKQTHAVLLPDPHHDSELRGSGELSYCMAPRYLENHTFPHAGHMQSHEQLQSTQKKNI